MAECKTYVHVHFTNTHTHASRRKTHGCIDTHKAVKKKHLYKDEWPYLRVWFLKGALRHTPTHTSPLVTESKRGSLPQPHLSPERHESQEAIVAAELQATRSNCATARRKLDKSGPDACDYVRACVCVCATGLRERRVTSPKGEK